VLLIGLVLSLSAGSLAACAPRRAARWAHDLPLPPEDGAWVIRPRDTLLVDVRNQKDLSGEFVVHDDGQYLQPGLGNLQAAGLTPPQLTAQLTRQLSGIIVDARVSVSLAKQAKIRVHVVGEVKTPGSYELARDYTVTAALAAAGWLSEYAQDDAIYVLRPAEQPPCVRFRVAELTAAEPHSARFRLRDGDVVVVE
jgi:polysaccharide export outer membrane protein